MANKIFSVDGDKIKTLLLTPTSMMLTSTEIFSEAAFLIAWDKKISLTTKTEIKFEAVNSITKEEAKKDIRIKYKGFANLPSEAEFIFMNNSDCNTFFTFLEKEQYFNKEKISLSAVKANFRYFLGLALTIFATFIAYIEAVDIKNGAAIETGNAKNKIFNYLVSFLGEIGVLIIGTTIAAYILYKIWLRIKKPPIQIKFTKPNSF